MLLGGGILDVVRSCSTPRTSPAGAAYSGAWAGLCNTHLRIDPTSGVTGAIYSQFLPFVTPESMARYAAFEAAIYAAR